MLHRLQAFPFSADLVCTLKESGWFVFSLLYYMVMLFLFSNNYEEKKLVNVN